MAEESFPVTGIILKVTPVLDYDRRIEVLTFERGRVAAFVRGARRPKSKLLGTTEQFCFGTFHLRDTGNAYTVMEADVKEYFEGLRTDLDRIYSAMYFAELCRALSRENADNAELAKLLFVALRALEKGKADLKLVRAAFILRALIAEGNGIEAEPGRTYSGGTKDAVAHLKGAEVSAVFGFGVSERVLSELSSLSDYNLARIVGYSLPGEEILKELMQENPGP